MNNPHAAKTCAACLSQILFDHALDLARRDGVKIKDIGNLHSHGFRKRIEGINLFLDSDRCVFVLGMDPNTVAASIENKYKDLFEKIRRENTAVVSPARLFLDKIIQVPFNVPPTTKDEITDLMSSSLSERSKHQLVSNGRLCA